jgi:hypothetical protein
VDALASVGEKPRRPADLRQPLETPSHWCNISMSINVSTDLAKRHGAERLGAGGEEYAETFEIWGGLKAKDSVLDIGCRPRAHGHRHRKPPWLDQRIGRVRRAG